MRPLLFACAVIALGAVAAPGLFERYLSVSLRPVAVDRQPATADDVRPPTAGGHVVEVRADASGHYYVEALVNLAPVRLMVDTGATVVALRQSDAEAAGILLNERDFERPVQTANGTANAAEVVLDSVAVGDIEVRRVRALVIPDARLSISLLGASFLHSLERVEVTDGTLVFEN
jgi:aspartyl protease family protein